MAWRILDTSVPIVGMTQLRGITRALLPFGITVGSTEYSIDMDGQYIVIRGRIGGPLDTLPEWVGEL